MLFTFCELPYLNQLSNRPIILNLKNSLGGGGSRYSGGSSGESHGGGQGGRGEGHGGGGGGYQGDGRNKNKNRGVQGAGWKK